MNFLSTKIAKTLIAFFIASLFQFNHALQAQEGLKIGFRVSPIAGVASVNDSTKQIPEGLTTKPQAGFDVGMMLNVGLSQSASLVTGVSYQQAKFSFSRPTARGASVLDSSKQEIKGLTTNSAVVVPLSLKLRSPEIGTGVYLWGSVGAQANINLAFESTEEVLIPETDRAGSTTYTIREVTESGTENINPITASFTPAFGLDAGNLQVGMSYHWGLMNIFNKSYEGPNSRQKLSYVALDLGYFF